MLARFRFLVLAVCTAALSAGPALSVDNLADAPAPEVSDLMPEPGDMPAVVPDPDRVSCQGGKGWARTIRVKPTEISYRVKGSTLTPGSLKPSSFERLAEEHKCLGVVLHGPQMSTCRWSKKDEEYQCSAARFIQIEKRDGDWSEETILKTLDRYTQVQCCVRRDDG